VDGQEAPSKTDKFLDWIQILELSKKNLTALSFLTMMLKPWLFLISS